MRFTCACATFLALGLGAGGARAQDASEPTSTDTPAQLWFNVTPGWMKGERWYWELDLEPKWQVSSGEQWRNLDVTPLVEYYPADWLDLEAEGTVGRTHQRDGLNTFEITERVGVRIRLFGKVVSHRPGIAGLKHERLPLTRVEISTLVRLEQRNFYYSDDSPTEHSWRARMRLESKLALNHRKLSEDRTLYAIADVEYYAPIGSDIPEKYVNKLRARLGAGYRFSAAKKLELLYIRDWNRDSPEAYAKQDAQALDFRVKLLI